MGAKYLGMSRSKKAPKKVDPELRVIGKRAADRREELGMTQTALADRLGITPPQVSRFESGARLLELKTLLRLCDVIGAPKGWIIAGEGDKPKPATFVETDGRKLRGDD